MYLKLRILRGLLIDRRGRNPGRDIVVRRRRFLIGTAPDCQLRCASRLVGRHHCAIDTEVDRIVLRDGGSRTGTYLNGTRITDAACLFHGDRLRVGRLELEIQLVAGRVRAVSDSPRRQRRRDVPAGKTGRSSPPPRSGPHLVPKPSLVPESGRDTVLQATDTVVDLVAQVRAARQGQSERAGSGPSASEGLAGGTG